jgi:hypothetical protein
MAKRSTIGMASIAARERVEHVRTSYLENVAEPTAGDNAS